MTAVSPHMGGPSPKAPSQVITRDKSARRAPLRDLDRQGGLGDPVARRGHPEGDPRADPAPRWPSTPWWRDAARARLAQARRRGPCGFGASGGRRAVRTPQAAVPQSAPPACPPAAPARLPCHPPQSDGSEAGRAGSAAAAHILRPSSERPRLPAARRPAAPEKPRSEMTWTSSGDAILPVCARSRPAQRGHRDPVHRHLGTGTSTTHGPPHKRARGRRAPAPKRMYKALPPRALLGTRSPAPQAGAPPRPSSPRTHGRPCRVVPMLPLRRNTAEPTAQSKAISAHCRRVVDGHDAHRQLRRCTATLP